MKFFSHTIPLLITRLPAFLLSSLNDLVSSLIHEADANGLILYEARESFNLSPKQFKALVAKAKRTIEEESDQRLKPALSTSSSSWSYLNGLGNLVFPRSFAIPQEKIHLSPIQARERYVLLYH